MSASADPIDCRLLEDFPRDGAENMAIDEALLISADEMSKPTLRFYAWSRPTLSLGYFQKYAHRRYHPASRLCAVVRRSTGGGAIVHDRELTYSFIWPGCRLPGKEKLSRPLATEGLYQTVHEALIRVLGRWEVQANLVADLATDELIQKKREAAEFLGHVDRRLEGFGKCAAALPWRPASTGQLDPGHLAPCAGNPRSCGNQRSRCR